MNAAINQVYYTSVLQVVDRSGNPVTTLTDSDFTKSVYHNGVADAVIATVEHLENGKYQAHFTPDKAGTWTIIMTQATYDVIGWAEHVIVGVALTHHTEAC